MFANTALIKNLPGRPTEANDAAWIADLLAHELVRSNFVPPTAIQGPRDLPCTLKQLVREKNQRNSWMHKVVEDANLKFDKGSFNVLGSSGMYIIERKSHLEKLADLTQGNTRKKRAELKEALRGRVIAHHRTMLKYHLDLIRAIHKTLEELDAALTKALTSIQGRTQLLMTMLGISDIAAEVSVAKIGVDMTRSPASTMWSRGHAYSGQ